MRADRGLAALAAPLALIGLLSAPGAAAAQGTATAQMMNAEGKEVGTVTLEEGEDGVVFMVAVKGLPPGEHAFHVHETGKCEPPFKSAGAHYNPTSAKHGKEADGGPHAGDMPNLVISEDGALKTKIVNNMVTLKEGAEATLFDDDGSALIIHAKPDDYKSQPSGAAGDRIVCGVVEQ